MHHCRPPAGVHAGVARGLQMRVHVQVKGQQLEHNSAVVSRDSSASLPLPPLSPCLHVFCTAFLCRERAHKLHSSAQSAREQRRTSSLLAPPCLSLLCGSAVTLHGSPAAQISVLKSYSSSHLCQPPENTAFSLVLKISWIPPPIASFNW